MAAQDQPTRRSTPERPVPYTGIVLTRWMPGYDAAQTSTTSLAAPHPDDTAGLEWHRIDIATPPSSDSLSSDDDVNLGPPYQSVHDNAPDQTMSPPRSHPPSPQPSRHSSPRPFTQYPTFTLPPMPHSASYIIQYDTYISDDGEEYDSPSPTLSELEDVPDQMAWEASFLAFVMQTRNCERNRALRDLPAVPCSRFEPCELCCQHPGANLPSVFWGTMDDDQVDQRLRAAGLISSSPSPPSPPPPYSLRHPASPDHRSPSPLPVYDFACSLPRVHTEDHPPPADS